MWKDVGVGEWGRVKAAKGLVCQAKESRHYPVGDGKLFMGCMQDSDLVNHHNNSRVLEVSSEEARLL